MGEQVMPSSHSGMSVLFAKRLADDLDVVIKVRAKANSFCDRAEEKEWRTSTEFMMNIPETDGIAKLYEVLEDRKGYYVIMEKVQGQDLFETCTGKGLLPVVEVKEVLRQLLQALQELHSRNCIHKDLKLENIMFDRTPPHNAKADWSQMEAGEKHSPVQVKLIDFDTVETVVPQTPKKAQDVLGTDQYIVQEAYDGNYSAASDIFAAGVIGYRLLTSKFPFKSDIFNDEAGENWVGSPKMKEIRDKLCKFKIDWSHRVFTLEPNARELLQAMLAVNEQQRPTADEALGHPWLVLRQRRRSVPNLGDSSQVAAGLAQERAASPLAAGEHLGLQSSSGFGRQASG
jgi:serine/threonine protein kinase